MKIEKSKPIQVEIYGQKLELKSPTFGQVKELSRLTKEDESKSIDAMSQFLISLGMGQDVLDSMDASHVQQLAEFITSKKN